ncbi:hypothetical protein OESDEN_05579 [Oesophagostomum dentatum]|uniref:Uncharacterized protein n=1 Tax=Oesophagostomum dentatum TaxID=61180 RepID=A0A0B1TA83_OESDE|nr:hypothetical protein OESDEN_05579 [Oesophagostomum dentatum]
MPLLQIITAVALKLFAKMAPVIADLRGIGVQCGRLVLASEVGYSVKSEAINRMFRARENKKDEQKDVQVVQKRETSQVVALCSFHLGELIEFYRNVSFQWLLVLSRQPSLERRTCGK